jgi:hypothetical protein
MRRSPTPASRWAASSRGRLGARRLALTLGWRQSSATPTPHAWESKPGLPSASEGEHRRHRTSSRSRNPGSGVPPHQHRLLGSSCERASHADGTAGISCAAASAVARSSETAYPTSLPIRRERRLGRRSAAWSCWTASRQCRISGGRQGLQYLAGTVQTSGTGSPGPPCDALSTWGSPNQRARWSSGVGTPCPPGKPTTTAGRPSSTTNCPREK